MAKKTSGDELIVVNSRLPKSLWEKVKATSGPMKLRAHHANLLRLGLAALGLLISSRWLQYDIGS